MQIAKFGISLLAVYVLLLLPGCGGGGGGGGGGAATLTAISISPANPSIANGATQQFNAMGTMSDSSFQDLTAQVTWNSSDTGVATISNIAGLNGRAAAVNAGTTTITASSGGITATTTLTVTAATLVSISITPADPAIAVGATQQFTATGTLSDNSTLDLTSQVTWNSSDTGVATISNIAGLNGRAAAVGAGTTTITATSGAISATTTLTVTAPTLVSISVTPAVPTIAVGATLQFTATGEYSDGSTQNLTTTATWSSSNTGVADVSNAAGSKGNATAKGVGTCTITASSGGKSGSTTLTASAGVGIWDTSLWDSPSWVWGN